MGHDHFSHQHPSRSDNRLLSQPSGSRKFESSLSWLQSNRLSSSTPVLSGGRLSKRGPSPPRALPRGVAWREARGGGERDRSQPAEKQSAETAPRMAVSLCPRGCRRGQQPPSAGRRREKSRLAPRDSPRASLSSTPKGASPRSEAIPPPRTGNTQPYYTRAFP